MNLIFDLETDGLLYNVSTIHCLAIHDLETGQTLAYNDTGNQEPLSRGIQRLQDAETIIGHNIIGYDIPVIRHLYPWFTDIPCVVDTLLLSRLYHSDMMSLDKKHIHRRCGHLQTWHLGQKDSMPLRQEYGHQYIP